MLPLAFSRPIPTYRVGVFSEAMPLQPTPLGSWWKQLGAGREVCSTEGPGWASATKARGDGDDSTQSVPISSLGPSSKVNGRS